jgi:hypothetical protein
MDIKDVRIGGQVTTKTGRIGQVTSAHEDGAVYVRFGSDYPEPARASDLEHFAPDACELRVGDKVRVVGKVDSMWGWTNEMTDAIGKIYTVKEALGDRVRLNGIGYQWPTGSIERVSACESCQRLDFVRSKRDEYLVAMIKEHEKARVAQEKCDGLQKSLDEMTCKSNAAHRNAAYWREACGSARRDAAHWHEELDKLRKEALEEQDGPTALWLHRAANEHIHPTIPMEDYMPLGEVAKIYVTTGIDASQLIRKARRLLLSDDARIICELLEGHGPLASWQISGRLHLLERCVLENIIEARDAGNIRLNKTGEYEFVREE